MEDPSPDVPPASGEADSLTWQRYVIPCITDVLATHIPYEDDGLYIECCGGESFDEGPHERFGNRMDWREHVAEILAARLEAVTLELPEAQ